MGVSRRTVLSALGVAAAAGGCSTPERHSTPEPEVHSDRRVTFRLAAGTASSVSVTGSWDPSGSPQPLSRDSGGGWSATLGPLPPSFYTYNFVVDGAATKDPGNSGQVHSAPVLSTFLVTGPGAEFITPGPGPRGTVADFAYRSAVTGSDRDATVWLPPGYTRQQRYPTLYLLHGGGGDHLDWAQQGRANVIMDNLHAAGRLTPMVVVMADGNVGNAMGVPPDDSFPTELIEGLVPAVQKEYHVSDASRARALAGLSLGGLHTWNVLLTRPGQIGYIGDFSAGYAPPVIASLTSRYQNLLRDTAVNAGTVAHRVYVGNTTDVVYADNVKTRAMFDAYGIRYTFQQFPGSGHTWETWRHNLLDFAPRLFR